MKNIILLIVVVLVHLLANAQGVAFLDNPEWKEAVRTAKKSGKLLFVDCYTVWCGPCKMMVRDIFPQSRVGEVYNPHFVAVKYDMEKPAGKAFGKQVPFRVESYPTFLFIDPASGKLIYHFIGSTTVENTIAEARKCLSRHNFEQLNTQYESGDRSFDFMKKYITAHSDMNESQVTTSALIDDYLRCHDTLSNLMQPEKWAFYKDFLTDIRTDYMQYVLVNYRKIRRLPFVDSEKLSENIFQVLDEALNRSFRLTKEGKDGRTILAFERPWYELARKNIGQVAKLLPAHERLVAKVALYDCLIARDWNRAEEVARHMVIFDFPQASYQQLLVLNYMAQQTNDRQILEKLLTTFRELQQQRTRQFANANYYNHIALVAGKLGLEEEAREAEQKYYELCKQCEQRAVQNKKTKGKKR